MAGGFFMVGNQAFTFLSYHHRPYLRGLGRVHRPRGTGLLGVFVGMVAVVKDARWLGAVVVSVSAAQTSEAGVLSQYKKGAGH